MDSWESDFFTPDRGFKSQLARDIIESKDPIIRDILKRIEKSRLLFPENLRKSLDGRLKDYSRFRGAVWELYILEQLNVAGYEIEFEKRIAINGKQIDFSWRNNGTDFHLEVTSKSGNQVIQKIEEHQVKLFDAVNSIVKVKNRLVNLSIMEWTELSPNIENIAYLVKTFIDQNRHQDLRSKSTLIDGDSNWKFELTLGDKRDEEWEIPFFTFGPISDEFVGLEDYREAINYKLSKFDGVAHGVNLIALVGAHKFPPTLFEAIQIVYGQPAIKINLVTNESINTLSDMGNFFPKNEYGANVSALILGYGSIPGFSSYKSVLICINPNNPSEKILNTLPFDAQFIRLTNDGFEISTKIGDWRKISSWDSLG